MSGRMNGKVALVTGAARGQGRSHAVRMAQEGADIIAVDICAQIDSVPYPMATDADLAETARQVEALDRRVVTAVADVRERSQLAANVRAGVSELGHFDVVVANAGISPIGQTVPAIAWFETVSVNLSGMVNTQAGGRPPRARPGPAAGAAVHPGQCRPSRQYRHGHAAERRHVPDLPPRPGKPHS
jgi:NAD(P)-dependent dehydrogenase (short-subunit alcohol dehydrogenase family)